jgi:hypothetical protein
MTKHPPCEKKCVFLTHKVPPKRVLLLLFDPAGVVFGEHHAAEKDDHLDPWVFVLAALGVCFSSTGGGDALAHTPSRSLPTTYPHVQQLT